MSEAETHAPAPSPSFRLIPSRFPPIGLFDTVASVADLSAVMELAGWTNDRLVAARMARLPSSEWVFGRANASIVMAAFLHAQPQGARFNSGDLGAWYAAEHRETAVVEVAHHMRRELVAQSAPEMSRQFRAYTARLDGSYRDIRGRQAGMPDVYASDSHAAGQILGERVRAGDEAGILYNSLRHAGGVNIVCYRPRNVLDVAQADHLEIHVRAASRSITVRRLSV